MQINCPICSTPIEIAKEHLGQKGRCTTCTSKFIIPATLADEFEILEHGTPPAAAPPAAAPAATPAAAPRTGPTLATPAAAPQRGVPAHLARKKSGNGGFIITCLIIGGGLVFGWMKMNEKGETDPSDEVAENDGEKEPKKPATDSPKGENPKTNSKPEVGESPPMSAAVSDTGGDGDSEPFESTAGETVAELAADKKARALAFLKSDLPNKREGAFKAMRNLGDAHKKTYAEILTQAREHHLKSLGDTSFDMSVGQNSMTAFEDAFEEWKREAGTALKLVLTNWKAEDANGYKAKHAEMDKAFEGIEKLHGKLVKSMAGAGGKEVDALYERVPLFTEFDTELAWANGEDKPSATNLGSLIREAGGADDFAELLALLDTARGTADDYAATKKHNGTINWGTSTYKAFAGLLNGRRQVLGLGALRLDEKLSAACEGHSGDMLFLDYFAHKGNDGSNFAQRAKRAGFTGAPSGECIYKGSPSAEAAHGAWWGSDGHRLIMYAQGPNTLGLGTASEVWTLNTGKKDW